MSLIRVNAGDDLQNALNVAVPGDVLQLEAGATFTGNFLLPQKPAGAVITVTSTAALPARRITPDDAPLLPYIVPTSVDPAIRGDHAANWKLDGLHIGSNAQGIYDAVGLDGCDNITFDRILLIGGVNGQKRGIRGNGTRITLTRSHIANIWSAHQDSQAFCAWDGAGPYTLTDNYLEGAGENVMFGGAASSTPAAVPADILVEGNHLFKPRTWQGQDKSVKNLFELKAAKRATIRGNVFENNWTHTQNGYAILFTVRNDDGVGDLNKGAPWTVVEDILFEHNRIIGTENGFNILGRDTDAASGQTTRVVIRHNLLVATGAAFLVGGEVGRLEIDHNTIDQGGNFMMFYTGRVWPNSEPQSRPTRYAVEDLTVTNTLAYHNEYGLIGEAAGIGTPALTNDIDPDTAGVQPHALAWRWTNNVLAGESGHPYPPVTLKPSVAEHRAQFNPDYTLKPDSAYKAQATDGSDLGAVVGAAPPEPPPVDPCADNPFRVTNIRWPDSYTGARQTLGFKANRAWLTATITRPGVLTVLSADGCESRTVKPGVTPEPEPPAE